ncbi:MAG: Calx-beta domain-containing protein [Verrucomicrobiia bacterium]
MKTKLHLIAVGTLLAAGSAGFGQPALQFTTNTYTVAENAGVATLTVRRTGDTHAVVTVDYATANGTATAGLDYTATKGMLIFTAGETNQSIVVPILNDGIVESTEAFTLTLSNATGGGVLGTPTNATVRITDNDVGLQFEFGPLTFPNSYRAGEAEGLILLAVIRGDDGAFPVSVDFATSGISATSGVDFTPTNGTLSFAAGEKVKVFTVPILNDGLKENNETFRVTLSNPTNQVLGSQKIATVTIMDNDAGVQFQPFNQYCVAENGGALTLMVGRGNDTNLTPCSVDYTFRDVTATNGLDYLGTNGTLNLAQGEMTKTLTIPILPNVMSQADKQFKVTLSSPTNAVLGPYATATITNLDTTGMKPHRFEGAAVRLDGSVQLTLGGGVHARFTDYYDLYPIEVSSNLVDWIPLVTLQRTNADTNPLTYTDTTTGDWPVRFYRTPATNLITPFSVRPSGPYAVGVRSRLLTDPSRRNRYNLSTNGSFMVSVWYPAVLQAGRLPGPLLDAQIAQDPFLAEQMREAYLPVTNLVDRTPQMVGYTVPDAPLAKNLTPCPVLLCSGMGYGFRASLAEKAAHFASHGYLVIVSDPCEAPATVFPDGTYFKQPFSPPYPSESLQERVRDLAFMLDDVTRWNANDAVFAGRLDLTKVATMGTCSGFDAAAQFCRFQARCQAAILVTCTPGKWVTPWDHFTSPIPELEQSGVGKPLLAVFADYADAANYYDFLYNKNAKDATVFQIQGASGGNIGDRGMILVQDFYSLLEPNRLDTGRNGARAIADFSLWFLNKYLKGSSDPSPPLANYPWILGFKQK